MNKKVMKIISMLIILAIITMFSMNIVNADGGFISPDELRGESVGGAEVKGFGNKIIGLLQAGGSILAVVILIVLGIKYMMGSAEEKAEYKKTMIPYIVGAILIFSSGYIAKAIMGLVQMN